MKTPHILTYAERRFTLHGIDISALQWPGVGLPVLALHGWLDNAASFLPLAPLLKDVSLLAPDLPGHGRSDHLPAAAEYHLADNCHWIVALADAMGWETFSLIGHSMGAAAASIAAAALPQRVDKLILIDGLGPLAFSPQQEVERLRQRLGLSSPTTRPRAFADLESAVQVRQRLGRFPITEDAATLITRRGMTRHPDGYRWSHDERLKLPGTHYYSEEQSEGILRAIEAPTLLLSGDDGAFRDWEGLARRKACIRQLQHLTLPGGHHLHMEQPEAVAAAINDFLR